MTAKGQRHTEETKKKISESKRIVKNRPPLVPQLCACGCGEYAPVDERRNRVSKYLSGHNSRVAHPMKGKHHTEETKVKLASYTGSRGSAYRHGYANTPTYNTWNSMISRCRDRSNASYENYGGRGITVCDRWKGSFENFLADMGVRPYDMTIDRIDSNGNYEKANCRWATKAQQTANRRPNSDPGGWKSGRASQG